MDDNLDIMQVAVMTHKHANTISRLVSQGKIPSFKIGRRRLFKRRDILRWIRDQNKR